ncbi:hypothetical protein TOPH_09059 [Tolypocladium ophioglossoides CBS 100239]|uniref:Uncharacterized protein n=1 Tax=Tolypocladium ophioglossoides (strain CBS 100239) TaxID=1163406 RepID=A0A0L0MWS2_TOLOC|nr:hypothetical protein TOPH_09059 [Tolypocladium ophioglossoides CBS 100239]
MPDSDSSSRSTSVAPTTASSSPTHLTGEKDDLLVPSPSEICRVFHYGQATWANLLSMVDDFPPGRWPTMSLEPYITLMDVPVPTHTNNSDQEWDPELVHGRRVDFNLETDGPLHCQLSSEAASRFLCNSTGIADSIAVLTMCWSYILSVRLLEMQGQQVKYTLHRLWPQTGECDKSGVIRLDGASPALVRWLCAVLNPELGWSASGKGLPPWAASLQEHLVIETSEPIQDFTSPPSSTEATELLLEFCRLFDLETEGNQNKQWDQLAPCRAGFLAALMIPFYRFMELCPQFPKPRLTCSDGVGLNDTSGTSIRGYLRDLRYFMTLSLHPLSLGSTLWSVFWQPDIDCNLVSPWLAAILDILEPTINAENLEKLLKAFALRRPRVALWWLALFVLGDLSILDWIRRYATTCNEKYGYGSLSPPDPMVSAWTGTKQSFLDQEITACYLEPSDQIPRADILRRRFDLYLQGSSSELLSWRPFGYVAKHSVEPDLWPYLETKRARRYQSFFWYSPQGRFRTSDPGFRRNTGRSIGVSRDDLTQLSSCHKCHEHHHNIKLVPSKSSTLRMISFLVEDATGSRHWSNAAMSEQSRQHPWLRGCGGLDTMEGECRGAADAIEGEKAPSWFLCEWIRGKYDGGNAAYEYGTALHGQVLSSLT